MMLDVRFGARGKTIETIDREPRGRAGYSVVERRHCLYRVQYNARPFIDLNEPIRCRGELWEPPKGREQRDACAASKRDYKFARMRGDRRNMAWFLSRARNLRCPWLRSRR